MREHRKWAWVALFSVAAAAPVAAQQGSVTSNGSQTTGNLSGTGGLTGGGAGQLGGNSGGGGGASGSGSQLQGTQLQTMTAPPKLSAPTGTASSSSAKSNFLSGYFANPYYQGTITSGTNGVPGGFGSALYPATGASRTTGATGGRGLGSQNSANQSGILVPLPVQINYSASMRFPTPPVATGRIQSDIRVVIDRTSEIANPKNVQIVTDEFNNVTLRGTVKDDDEARLVEGLVRLTPGVGAIKNELTATASAGPPGK